MIRMAVDRSWVSGERIDAGNGALLAKKEVSRHRDVAASYNKWRGGRGVYNPFVARLLWKNRPV